MDQNSRMIKLIQSFVCEFWKGGSIPQIKNYVNSHICGTPTNTEDYYTVLAGFVRNYYGNWKESSMINGGCLLNRDEAKQWIEHQMRLEEKIKSWVSNNKRTVVKLLRRFVNDFWKPTDGVLQVDVAHYVYIELKENIIEQNLTDDNLYIIINKFVVKYKAFWKDSNIFIVAKNIQLGTWGMQLDYNKGIKWIKDNLKNIEMEENKTKGETKITGYKLKKGVRSCVVRNIINWRYCTESIKKDDNIAKTLERLGVLDLLYDPIIEEEVKEERVFTLYERNVKGSCIKEFQIKVKKEGIFYEESGKEISLDIKQLKEAIGSRWVGLYNFEPIMINCGCKKNVLVSEWNKVLDAYYKLSNCSILDSRCGVDYTPAKITFYGGWEDGFNLGII